MSEVGIFAVDGVAAVEIEKPLSPFGSPSLSVLHCLEVGSLDGVRSKTEPLGWQTAGCDERPDSLLREPEFCGCFLGGE
jgi:hypothetical protein